MKEAADIKRKITVFILILLILITMPGHYFTYAATPYFTAVNNFLMPLRESTMPFFSGGVLYVPHDTFKEFGINSIASIEAGMVHLYKGTQYVDFYEADGTSIDQDGRVREGVSARRHNGIYYLPLGVVGSYFDLRFDIITYDPISIIRIKSGEAVSSGGLLDERNFISIHKNKMQNYAADYFASQTQDMPSEDDPESPPPVVQTPVYSSVTVHLSFYDVTVPYAVRILDALSAPGYRACFFVSVADIAAEPGLIRRISGSGHSVGIWLAEGTFDEYVHASKLLFEAAKIKTVLVTSDDNSGAALETAREHNLIYHEASFDLSETNRLTPSSVTSKLPTVHGASYSLRLPCTSAASDVLPDVLAYLRKHEYTVVKITETTF